MSTSAGNSGDRIKSIDIMVVVDMKRVMATGRPLSARASDPLGCRNNLEEHSVGLPSQRL